MNLFKGALISLDRHFTLMLGVKPNHSFVIRSAATENALSMITDYAQFPIFSRTF